METTAVYVRCSSATQSNDSQRYEIETYLAQQVICENVRWYEDSAVTGAKLTRPALSRLHRDIVEGKVSTVVVWKIDRLSRSIVDGVKLLSEWVDRGIRVISVTQQIDLSGAIGRIVASLLLGIAEMERENLRERQAAGIANAKSRGIRFGRPRSVDVTCVHALRTQGTPVSQIARRLGISRQSVYNALQTISDN